VIRVVCAWCGKDLGEKEGESGEGGNVSHGICPKCFKKVKKEGKK